MEAVLAGGYPEALTRSGWRRRQDWHLDYVEAILQRDIRDIARIEQLGTMRRLMRVLPSIPDSSQITPGSALHSA